MIQTAQPLSLINSIKKRKGRHKQNLSAWMNSDYSSLDSRSQPQTSQSNGNIASKGFPAFLKKQDFSKEAVGFEQSDFLKKQNLINHNMNTIRVPREYGLNQEEQFQGSPILEVAKKGNKIQFQSNYFSNLASKTQTININKVKRQFLNSKEHKFSSTLLPRIGEGQEKNSSEDETNSISKENQHGCTERSSTQLPPHLNLKDYSSSKPKIRKRSTYRSNNNTDRSSNNNIRNTPDPKINTQKYKGNPKHHHMSDHIRGRLIQHNLRGQHMPSRLQHYSGGELLSQSNTSMDSTDIKKKLTFTNFDEITETNTEFIGIERGDWNDEPGQSSISKTKTNLPPKFNRSFEKKKVPKTSARFGKKKKSNRSMVKSKKLNKSKNGSMKNTLSKLKLSEINQSLLLNGSDKGFLDKFDQKKKENRLQNFVQNIHKFGRLGQSKRRSRSGSKHLQSSKLGVLKNGKNLKSAVNLRERSSKNGKTLKSGNLNRSIEFISNKSRAKSSAHKKSHSKIPLSKNNNLFRTFIDQNKFSYRGGSSHRKV